MTPAELRALAVALDVAASTGTRSGSWHQPRARDMQREKLYRAERAAFDERRDDDLTLVECRVLIARAFEWARRVGLTPDNRCLDFRIADGRGCRNASAGWGGRSVGGWRITLPRWGRTPSVALHEAAHCLQPAGSAWHGWQFAAIFLALVEEFMGPSHAANLQAHFTAGRVRFRRPRPSTPLSPERRAILVAQLAAARLGRVADSRTEGQSP